MGRWAPVAPCTVAGSAQLAVCHALSLRPGAGKDPTFAPRSSVHLRYLGKARAPFYCERPSSG